MTDTLRFTFRFTKDNLAVTKALVKAGADLEAKAACFTLGSDLTEGNTPLHLDAGGAFGEITAALVGAGADVNCRLKDGTTSLDLSARCGRLGAVSILIRGKANPSLPMDMNLPLGSTAVVTKKAE